MLTKLRKIWDESRKVKDVVEKDWNISRDMIRGQQLPKRRPEHKPPAVLNLLRPLIERKLAMLTDTKPRFTVQPRKSGEQNASAARMLDEVLNAWWDDAGIDMALTQALYYAQAYGTCVVQTRWSTSGRDIVLDVLDPHNFYIDPYILTPDQLQDSEYLIYEEFPSLEAVKMRFGKKADDLKPWSPPSDQGGDTAISRIARRLVTPWYKDKDQTTAIPHTWLRHFWLKDYSHEDIEVKKDDKTITMRRQKFPGGRYVIMGHENTILHDEPNPYYDMQFPFDMMSWYMDIESPWGDSEVQAHKSPQMLLNKLAELAVENAMLMTNGVWVCDQNAFPADDGPTGWGQLNNVPGNIIKKRPGSEVRRDFPQGLPTASMQLIQHLEQFIESRAGGFSEVMTGRKPGQVQSGLGVEQLQMTASALIRLKARALEGMISRIGQKCISRVIQFYTSDRVFHTFGPGEVFREYEFIRSQFRKALSTESLAEAHKDFRFRVAPGSSLSLTKIQKALIAQQLYTMGCVDRQYLLETLEVPDWPTVLKRTVQEQAMGVEPPGAGQKGKKKGMGAVERKMTTAGRN